LRRSALVDVLNKVQYRLITSVSVLAETENVVLAAVSVMAVTEKSRFGLYCLSLSICLHIS